MGNFLVHDFFFTFRLGLGRLCMKFFNIKHRTWRVETTCSIFNSSQILLSFQAQWRGSHCTMRRFYIDQIIRVVQSNVIRLKSSE